MEQLIREGKWEEAKQLVLSSQQEISPCLLYNSQGLILAGLINPLFLTQFGRDTSSTENLPSLREILKRTDVSGVEFLLEECGEWLIDLILFELHHLYPLREDGYLKNKRLEEIVLYLSTKTESLLLTEIALHNNIYFPGLEERLTEDLLPSACKNCEGELLKKIGVDFHPLLLLGENYYISGRTEFEHQRLLCFSDHPSFPKMAQGLWDNCSFAAKRLCICRKLVPFREEDARELLAEELRERSLLCSGSGDVCSLWQEIFEGMRKES